MERRHSKGIACKDRQGKRIAKIKSAKGQTRVIVKESVKEQASYIVGAVIRNVRITDEFLEQLIQLQEK